MNIGITAQQFTEMVKGNIVSFTGKLFSKYHKKWFELEQQNLSIAKKENKIGFYVGNQHLNQWFSNVLNKMNIRKLIEEQRRRKQTIKR